ncbi:MAG: hypothetical protein R3E66_03560 [bacterium]
MNYRVWSEFLPYEEAADAHVLRLLSRWKVTPHIAVKHDADLDGLANVLQAAASFGVSVWLWPLLSHHDGYWANESNVATWSSEVHSVLHFLEGAGTPPAGIAVDLEPPIELVTPWTRTLPFGEIATLIARNLDASRFAQAERDWQRVANDLTKRGYATLAITTPAAAHDLRDGKPVWQDLLETPWSGVGWGVKGVMAYNSMIAGYSRGLLTIEDARAMHHRLLIRLSRAFGPDAHVSLGVTGAGVLGDEVAYASPTELLADVAAARHAGIQDIGLFCLEGVLDRPDPDAWFEAFTSQSSAPPPTSWKTPLVRSAAWTARRLALSVRALEIFAEIP